MLYHRRIVFRLIRLINNNIYNIEYLNNISDIYNKERGN